MANRTPAAVAAFAESIELVAVAAYDRCLPLITSSFSAGSTPAALVQFQQHHRAHALTFGGLAGASATHRANPPLTAALEPRLAGLSDDRSALAFLLDLENQLVETYAFELSHVDDTDVVRALASILPVEAEHATLAGTTLGLLGANLFPNGSAERAEVGDVTDSRYGFDATLYPPA